jgi:hypothetical protein
MFSSGTGGTSDDRKGDPKARNYRVFKVAAVAILSVL